MPSRLTSSVFVAALLRRVQAEGGFAYVARRGNGSAGAVFLAVYRHATGDYELLAPAPSGPDDDDPASGGRSFVADRFLEDSDALRRFIESESRFDPDFWLVEIENLKSDIAALVTIAQ